MQKVTNGRSSGGVQSLDRAFMILETMADAGGVIGLSQLSEKAGLPLATIHRLIRTLVDLGYVRQEESRQYALGPRLMRLADTTAVRIGTWANPYMTAAVSELHESVNLAVLDGDAVVYVAQVQPSSNFMRMFTEVGRRTLPHSTAVGKAMLAGLTDDQIEGLLQRTGMPRHTDQTLTTPEELLSEVAKIRERGYAVDEGEQEIGVRCVAVAVPDAPKPMAISMSGPSPRVDDDKVAFAAPILLRAAEQISAELKRPSVNGAPH
jgi:IclR family acetate operon transcriptional repressor